MSDEDEENKLLPSVRNRPSPLPPTLLQQLPADSWATLTPAQIRAAISRPIATLDFLHAWAMLALKTAQAYNQAINQKTPFLLHWPKHQIVLTDFKTALALPEDLVPQDYDHLRGLRGVGVRMGLPKQRRKGLIPFPEDGDISWTMNTETHWMTIAYKKPLAATGDMPRLVAAIVSRAFSLLNLMPIHLSRDSAVFSAVKAAPQIGIVAQSGESADAEPSLRIDAGSQLVCKEFGEIAQAARRNLQNQKWLDALQAKEMKPRSWTMEDISLDCDGFDKDLGLPTALANDVHQMLNEINGSSRRTKRSSNNSEAQAHYRLELYRDVSKLTFLVVSDTPCVNGKRAHRRKIVPSDQENESSGSDAAPPEPPPVAASEPCASTQDEVSTPAALSPKSEVPVSFTEETLPPDEPTHTDKKRKLEALQVEEVSESLDIDLEKFSKPGVVSLGTLYAYRLPDIPKKKRKVTPQSSASPALSEAHCSPPEGVFSLSEETVKSLQPVEGRPAAACPEGDVVAGTPVTMPQVKQPPEPSRSEKSPRRRLVRPLLHEKEDTSNETGDKKTVCIVKGKTEIERFRQFDQKHLGQALWSCLTLGYTGMNEGFLAQHAPTIFWNLVAMQAESFISKMLECIVTYYDSVDEPPAVPAEALAIVTKLKTPGVKEGKSRGLRLAVVRQKISLAAAAAKDGAVKQEETRNLLESKRLENIERQAKHLTTRESVTAALRDLHFKRLLLYYSSSRYRRAFLNSSVVRCRCKRCHKWHKSKPDWENEEIIRIEGPDDPFFPNEELMASNLPFDLDSGLSQPEIMTPEQACNHALELHDRRDSIWDRRREKRPNPPQAYQVIRELFATKQYPPEYIDRLDRDFPRETDPVEESITDQRGQDSTIYNRRRRMKIPDMTKEDWIYEFLDNDLFVCQSVIRLPLHIRKAFYCICADFNVSPPLLIGEDQVKGRAVYAGANIYRGDFVCEYRGKWYTQMGTARTEELAHEKAGKGSFMFFFMNPITAAPNCIDGTEEDEAYGLARLINHSHRQPNLEISVAMQERGKDGSTIWKPRLMFTAKRDIAIGEELLIDYGETAAKVVENNVWLQL